jgi:hypothetical protein
LSPFQATWGSRGEGDGRLCYIVCGQLGLELAARTIPDVAGWGKGGALDPIQQDAQTA